MLLTSNFLQHNDNNVVITQQDYYSNFSLKYAICTNRRVLKRVQGGFLISSIPLLKEILSLVTPDIQTLKYNGMNLAVSQMIHENRFPIMQTIESNGRQLK